VLGLSGAAVGAGIASTAVAAPVDGRTVIAAAAGVAVIDGTPKVLCQVDGRWVVAGDGGLTNTRGLEKATVLGVSNDPSGVVAVGTHWDGIGTNAAVWRSVDGIAWQEALSVEGHSEFTAVACRGGHVLAIGSVLTDEDVPREVVVARQEPGRSWSTLPVRGMEAVGGYSITAAAGTVDGWICAVAGSGGATLFRSGDGVTWTSGGKLPDVVVQELLIDVDERVSWIANAINGSTPLVDPVGGRPAPAAVPVDAVAVGAAESRHSRISYWLVGGRLVAADF
jgi:hypothetical protein